MHPTVSVSEAALLSPRLTSPSSLGRFQVHYSVHGPGKAKRLSSCKRKGCRLEEVGSKLRRSASDVGRVHDPGMANKENELTCSGAAWAVYYNDSCGLLLNSAQASKMAGAGSQPSDVTEASRCRRAGYQPCVRFLTPLLFLYSCRRTMKP